MEELLSLKWKNHKNGFLKLLTSIRKKNAYTDVTLACDGKLYNAHKIVLSASSDYFNQIFETILSPNPVIVLKDITRTTLESLLDYIYLGEVEVRPSELSLFIEAAECLKVKGLAVPGSDITSDTVILGSKRKSLNCLSSGRKRLRNYDTKDPLCSRNLKQQNKTTEIIINDTLNFSSAIITEDNSNDEISIKSETDYMTEDYVDSDLNYDTTKHIMSTEIISTIEKDHAYPTSFITNTNVISKSLPTIRSQKQIDNPDNETINLNEAISSNMANIGKLPTNRSPKLLDIMKSVCSKRKRCCSFCKKTFTGSHDLQRHIRIHTGVRPFACDYCSYRSTALFNLKRHIRIHTGEKVKEKRRSKKGEVKER